MKITQTSLKKMGFKSYNCDDFSYRHSELGFALWKDSEEDAVWEFSIGFTPYFEVSSIEDMFKCAIKAGIKIGNEEVKGKFRKLLGVENS